MRIIWAILLAAFLCIAANVAPTAWSKTSWGMTDAQIRAALPDQVIDLPATTANSFQMDGAREIASVGIASLTIEGTEFKVWFLTGTKGLHHVMLQPADNTAAHETLFRKVEAALVLKYGQPFSSTEKGSVSTKYKSQWKTETSVIQLDYIDFFSISTKILILDYTPLPKNGNL